MLRIYLLLFFLVSQLQAQTTMIIPPNLQKGDTIAIVATARKNIVDNLKPATDLAKSWGLNVVIGKTIGLDNHQLAGTDEQRAADFQEMIDNPNIKAVWCVRGGYGTARMVELVDFSKFKQAPKWIIGFSDITVLLAHIYNNFNIAGLHAPMAAAFKENGYLNDYVGSLHKSLLGEKGHFIIPSHHYNRAGSANGVLVGGNLSLIVNLIGTPSALDTNHKILFLEDIGEYLYGIDRMMHQLKRGGFLEGLKGLIVGGFTDGKDTTIPFGKTVEELILDIVSDYDYPVGFGFPVSHSIENYTLTVGGYYNLDITEDWLRLKQHKEN
jgi:muramoyltetrapeptide carboxypeptidase